MPFEAPDSLPSKALPGGNRPKAGNLAERGSARRSRAFGGRARRLSRDSPTFVESAFSADESRARSALGERRRREGEALGGCGGAERSGANPTGGGAGGTKALRSLFCEEVERGANFRCFGGNLLGKLAPAKPPYPSPFRAQTSQAISSAHQAHKRSHSQTSHIGALYRVKPSVDSCRQSAKTRSL